jgi:hypothetical protein
VSSQSRQRSSIRYSSRERASIRPSAVTLLVALGAIRSASARAHVTYLVECLDSSSRSSPTTHPHRELYATESAMSPPCSSSTPPSRRFRT